MVGGREMTNRSPRAGRGARTPFMVSLLSNHEQVHDGFRAPGPTPLDTLRAAL